MNLTEEQRWYLLRRAWRLEPKELRLLADCDDVDGVWLGRDRLTRQLRREGLIDENPQAPGEFRISDYGNLVLRDFYWFKKQRWIR